MINRITALFLCVLFFAGCETSSELSATTKSDANANITSNTTNDISSSNASGGVHHSKTIVNFDFDSAILSDTAKIALSEEADHLKSNPSFMITIEGHCDERGTREYNLGLGERRASAARDFLVAKGINPSRIRTISYGKERPLVIGSNENAWAMNRRAVVVAK